MVLKLDLLSKSKYNFYTWIRIKKLTEEDPDPSDWYSTYKQPCADIRYRVRGSRILHLLYFVTAFPCPEDCHGIYQHDLIFKQGDFVGFF